MSSSEEKVEKATKEINYMDQAYTALQNLDEKGRRRALEWLIPVLLPSKRRGDHHG